MKKRKQSRKYITVFAVVALLGLIITAGLTFVMDPLYQYHMPWFGREVYTYSEIYQNPGLAKNADYDAIIVGSSMSENFNCEWFDEAYDVNTLKLTISGSTAQDWVNMVTLAEENQNVRYVFSNMDLHIMASNYGYGETKWELPQYLYDNNYFNDVYYLFNKDIFFDRTITLLQNNYTGNLKNAYAWYERNKNTFNHKSVLQSVDYKGECNDIEQKIVTIDDSVRKVVAQIKETILKYPDTNFEIFYSPFSLIYYYRQAVQGNLDTSMEVIRYSMRELLECENCRLYFPTYDNIEMIADLDSYRDLSHYDMDIQYKIFEEMRDGVNRVTKDNYENIINWFRNEIMNYDFKHLYEIYNS